MKMRKRFGFPHLCVLEGGTVAEMILELFFHVETNEIASTLAVESLTCAR